MITKVLRKLPYEGTYIYILQYHYTFQYLFAWKNEVYRQEIIMRPGLLRRMAWRTGISKSPYTVNQLEQGEQVVISGAMKSIDLLKQDKSGSQRRKAEKEAKKKKAGNKCQWQARADEQGKPIYLCIIHNEVAPLEDNPHHE